MDVAKNSTVSFANSSSFNVNCVNTAPSTLYKIKYYVALMRICCLYPLGIIGSIFTILVIYRTTLGSPSFKCCIMVIAIADGLRLTISSILSIPHIILWSKPGWFCKAALFMVYFTSILSDNVVTLLSIERVVSVVSPYKVHKLFTLKRVRYIILLVIIYDGLINILLVFTIESNGFGGCTSFAGHSSILQIFTLIITVNFLVCVVVILVSAILIKYKLRQRYIQAAVIHSGLTSNDTQISIMLLSIAWLYVVTTLPILATRLYMVYISTTNTGIYVCKEGLLMAMSQTATIFKELGHIGNFYAYCLSAKMFRQSFNALIMSYLSVCRKCSNSVEPSIE